MRQSAKEIMQSGAMENFKEVVRQRAESGNQWRCAVLYESLWRLVKAIAQSKTLSFADTEMMDAMNEGIKTLNAVDASLGRPERKPGILVIPRESK